MWALILKILIVGDQGAIFTLLTSEVHGKRATVKYQIRWIKHIKHGAVIEITIGSNALNITSSCVKIMKPGH